MGRITIFAADGCPHCTRVKVALSTREIPFHEISVTRYPQKRKDMLALSDRVSTPQVFFNTRHIGGADETIALLQVWDAEKKELYPTPQQRYMAEIGNQFDPSNPRLALPEDEKEKAWAEEISKMWDGVDQPKCISVPIGGGNNKMMSVLEVIEMCKTILPSRDNQQKLTRHKMSFTGKEAVNAFCKKFNIEPEAAIKFGQQMQSHQHQILHSIRANQDFDDSESSLFRLQCYSSPEILNSYRIWTKPTAISTCDDPTHPVRVLDRLTNYIRTIESTVTNGRKGSVDYEQAVKLLPAFPIFEEAVCELQTVSLDDMDDKTKTAFGINLYNLMIKYAFMKVGAGTTDISRYVFYNSIKFNVGGYVFSFQDWENGILRGNRKAPYSLKLQFDKKDPRLKLAVKEVDARLHFGLNCGARSCPPVNNYSVDDLEEELTMAAHSFCEHEENVHVDKEKMELHLSKIFAWYKIDFARNNKELPSSILQYLRRVKHQDLDRMIDSGRAIRIVFKDYDWNSNATNVKAFDSLELKLGSRSIIKGILGSQRSKDEEEIARFSECPEQSI